MTRRSIWRTVTGDDDVTAMHQLILYYSWTGNNALLARHLATQLSAELVEVVTRRPRRQASIYLDLLFRRRPRIQPLSMDPSHYDHVLVVAPVWDRHVGAPMASALRAVGGQFSDYSFLTFCGYEREGQEHVLREQLRSLTGKAPHYVWQLVVGNLLEPEQRGWVRAASARRVRPAELDHFATDLEVIVQTLQVAA